jgi:hypothetical protein
LFLLRFLGVDHDALIQDAIRQGLAERGLSYSTDLDAETPVGDGMWTEEPAKVVTFSDGRVFRERPTVEERWDDAGHDHFTFVEDGTDHEVERIFHTEWDEVEDSMSLEELREEDPVLGPAIADFFEGQGIDRVSFEPGDET